MPINRARRIGTVVAMTVCLVACTGPISTLQPGDSGRGSAKASPGWQRLPDPPLTPRGNAVMVSTGDEVLVIGGRDTHPCPPNADCIAGRIRRDGAALNLTTGTWRTIAPAPIPISGGQAVVVDTGVYLLAWPSVFATGRTPGGLLHYDIATDRWDQPAVSDGENDGLAVVGDRLLIYTRYAESGHIRDRILDEVGVRDLPPDPPAPSGLRSLVPVDNDRLILLAHPIDHTLGKRPAFIRAAELDLSTGRWRLLPKSNIVGGWQWWLTDELLVAPSWGELDGGEVDNWGRSYPDGGIFDPETRRWRLLPAEPPHRDDRWHGPAVADSELLIAGGHVWDPESGSWTRLPEPVPGLMDSRSAVWTGNGERLVAFGGTVHTGRKLAFTAQTWMWQPTTE